MCGYLWSGDYGDCYFLVHASCISSCLQWTYIACKSKKKQNVIKNEKKKKLVELEGGS